MRRQSRFPHQAISVSQYLHMSDHRRLPNIDRVPAVCGGCRSANRYLGNSHHCQPVCPKNPSHECSLLNRLAIAITSDTTASRGSQNSNTCETNPLLPNSTKPHHPPRPHPSKPHNYPYPPPHPTSPPIHLPFPPPHILLPPRSRNSPTTPTLRPPGWPHRNAKSAAISSPLPGATASALPPRSLPTCASSSQKL